MSHLPTALLHFQAEAPPIHLDATNPHFGNKFASLGGVVAAVRPALNKHGLIYTQRPTNIDGAPALETCITHAESGEEISAITPLILAKQDPQGYGSALTYARRYALLSILGLVGDADDDAHAASSAGESNQPDRSGAGNSPAETLIPFGKHKGQRIDSAPSHYWEWWLGSDHAAKPEMRDFRALVELHMGLTGVGAPASGPDPLDDIPFA